MVKQSTVDCFRDRIRLLQAANGSNAISNILRSSRALVSVLGVMKKSAMIQPNPIPAVIIDTPIQKIHHNVLRVSVVFRMISALNSFLSSILFMVTTASARSYFLWYAEMSAVLMPFMLKPVIFSFCFFRFSTNWFKNTSPSVVAMVFPRYSGQIEKLLLFLLIRDEAATFSDNQLVRFSDVL